MCAQPRLPQVWRCILWAMLALSAGSLYGQDDDQDEMKIMERIVELEHQLKAEAIADRDQAEAALIALGPIALRHLKSTDPSMTSDQIARLARIRLALEKLQVESMSRASRVSFSGEMTLPQVLALIKRQTDNDVHIDEHVPNEWVEKKVKVDFVDISFWQAIDAVQQLYGLEIDPFRGGRHRLQLNLPRRVATGQDDAAVAVTEPAPVTYSNMFRLEISRIDTVRHFRNAAANRTVCTLSISWEPRLLPLAIDLPLSSVRVVDENDRAISIATPGVLSMAVEPGISEAEFSLSLPLFERQVEKIKSLSGQLEVVMAGTAETFEFVEIARQTPGCSLRRADATVSFVGLRKNEDLFELSLMLSYEEDNNALESHRAWAFDNEVFLRRPDGQKIKPIGMETYQQSNTGLGVRYLFIDVPADAHLIYRAPAAVVKLEVPFEFASIRLP